MKNSITIEEQSNYKFWKTGTYISGILCIIIFLVFWNISDPFWGGIFRLISFIFFTLAVLGSLKLLNGPLTVTLSSSGDHLDVSYRKKEKPVHKEHFDRSTIVKVTVSKGKQNMIKNYLQPDLATMKIDFSDSDRNLLLFEFGGRPLFFDQSTIKQIKEFLQAEGIELSV